MRTLGYQLLDEAQTCASRSSATGPSVARLPIHAYVGTQDAPSSSKAPVESATIRPAAVTSTSTIEIRMAFMECVVGGGSVVRNH